MNAATQSTDLRRPLLWSLAVHCTIILAIGLAAVDAPSKPEQVLVIQLQPPASTSAPTSALSANKTPVKTAVAPTESKPVTKSAVAPVPALSSTANFNQATAVTPKAETAVAINTTALQQSAAPAPETVSNSAPVTNSHNEPAIEQAPQFDAAYLQNPKPTYPAFAKRRNQQGTVLLRVQVSADGKADSVNIAESSGIKALDDAAQQAVRQWRFVPAHRGELAISAWVLVPITFKLS